MKRTMAPSAAGILRRLLTPIVLFAASAYAGAAPSISDVPVAPERVSRVVAAKAAAGEPVEALVLLDDSKERNAHAADAQNNGLPAAYLMSPAQYAQDAAAWAQRLNSLKAQVKAGLTGDDLVELKQFSQFPILHVRIASAAAFERLRAHGMVLSIDEIAAEKATLAQSLPLIGQPAAQAAGHTGTGTTVAVLDTGVNYTHSAFGSCVAPGGACKVVYAADFAPSDGSLDDNGHGTNVSGTVLGVAPGAKIAGLDVFRTDGFTYTDDQIAAVNWVVANKATYNIVSINMSLGGSVKYTSPVAMTDTRGIALQSAINAGVAVVISSGNSTFIDGLTLPGAYQNVISVGAVYDSNMGTMAWSSCTDSTTAADKVTCFSNSASFLTILAPGALITAAGITQGGTSQASPHVAGAVALVKAANPSYSVAQVRTALLNGTNVTDTRNGIVKPRLNLSTALGGGTSPTLSVVVSGTGTVTSAPAGISCPGTCSASFASGSAVTLTATPTGGAVFGGWSGDCAGGSLSCVVSMTAAKSVTATFFTGDDNWPPSGLAPSGWTGSPGSGFGWAVATDSVFRGTHSLKSATMVSNGLPQSAGTRTSGNFPAGEIAFAYRVSSEANYDFFEFWIDGVLVHSDSGNKPWTFVSFPVTAGAHTFDWVYRKDISVDGFSNAAWIDSVVYPGGNRRVPQDMNGNGKSDWFYYNVSTGQLWNAYGDGTSLLAGSTVYTEKNVAWKIVAMGDFNGDRAVDLLWRHSETGQVFLMPMEASGSGFPGAGQSVTTEPNKAWKIIGAPDLNGDGKADILWWNSATGQVYAMLMNGATRIGEAMVHTEPNTAWQIHGVGDFSGSGKQNQLLWRNLATGQIFIMTVNYAGGVFTQTGQMAYTASSPAWRIAGVGDFSGDGRSDILFRHDQTGHIYGLIMNGASVAQEGTMFMQPDLAWKVAALGDYNGDGRTDILMRNEATGQVQMSQMNGLGVSLQQVVYAETGTAWRLLGEGELGSAAYLAPAGTALRTDFNADRKSDLLYRNSATGQVSRVFMDSLSIAGGAQVHQEPDTNWQIVAEGDLNGDGLADLVWRHKLNGQVYYMPFAHNGFPVAGRMVTTEANQAWKIVQAPDLDGDGRADLLWWNSATGAVWAMLMNGGDIVGQGPVATEPNTSWRIFGAGDFNGTGKHNGIVWRNVSTGQVYLMTVNYGGNGVFTQSGVVIYQAASAAWKILGVADFNRSGTSDILWRNETTGQIYVLLMAGPTALSEGPIYTEPNLQWKPVAFGDYNGDGISDVLLRNDTTGQLYLLIMNGLQVFAQAMVYQEANTNWKVMGPLEYGTANGLFP